MIKFLIRDESKKIKQDAYSEIIELNNPLIYLNNAIEINDIKLSDSLIIKYKTNKQLEKEEKVVIKIKKLKQDNEEDVVWTIGNFSFINLTYELNSSFNSNQIYNRVKMENKKNINFDTFLGDLNGELATCSTGSTVKRENYQFYSDKIQNKNNHLINDSTLIKDEEKSLINKQKKFIKEEDKTKSFKKLKNIPNNNYQILEDNSNINDKNNIYSKEYLSKLKYSEFEYDTFCQCILITGLKFGKLNLIEKSEEFPASCCHKECSILQSVTPSILYWYQNSNKKYKIDINDLTPYLIFPLGIKICMAYDSLKEYPKQKKSFMNRIENKKGESFYIMSLIYYKQMTFTKFIERYKINPLLSYSNNNKNKNFEKEMEIISKLALNETIFVPECISLISRFPYFYQMDKCLKTLISLTDNRKINLFANYLINRIPIPFKNQEILFYIPNNPIPIKILSPFNFNTSNYQNLNLFNIFSIQNIIMIFYLILMEQQILFISNDYNILSSITYLFLNFIYPFTWSNTYIPILSFSSVKFLESIIPYIMGADESLVKYALENQNIGNKVIFVNISNNEIYLNSKKRISMKNANKLLDIPKFPENFENMLNKKLDIIKKLNNNSLIIENMRYTFCKIMVLILNNYLEHCFIIEEDIIFNNESYLERKRPDEKNFYKELIQTQLFSQFLLSRKEQFIKNKKYIRYNNIKKDKETRIDFESFIKDSKIISNTYGNIYENLYIDYSLFHEFEIDYSLKLKSVNLDDLSIQNKNNLKKSTIEFNKSSKIHVKYSLNLIKNKKNGIDKKLVSMINNNYQTDSISNISTKNLSSVKYKTNKLINNSLRDDVEANDLDYSFEESKKYKEITLKQTKTENESSFLLFPYFIEKEKDYINKENKNEYIKNTVDEIINVEKQINKIIKADSIPEYILPSYKRYELYLINEDYIRYFPNSLRNYNPKSDSGKGFSSEFSSEDEEKSENDENKDNLKLYNDNLKKNNKDIIIINEWFNIICSSDKKRSKNTEANNIIKLLLNNRDSISYFCDLIFQDYIPLFKYIKSNLKKILTHDCLNELYKVILKILPKLNSNDYLLCKQLTLSFFIYGYYNQKMKNIRFIISKLNDWINSSIISIDKICSLWGDIKFWNFWILNDLETYKNNIFYINIESNSFDGNENNIIADNNEYEYISDICKILILLGKNNNFIKKCIFENIAPKYLTPYEISDLEDTIFDEKE